MIKYVSRIDGNFLKDIEIAPRPSGGQHRRSKVQYKDVISAFDIETSYLPTWELNIMYVWQWQFGKDLTIIGRTWDELRTFMKQLRSTLKENERLVTYVHNLSYEFQFLRTIYDFKADEVFCTDSRRILRCTMWDKIELRCSYLQTNMSLAEFTEKMDVEHKKLDGDTFDYNIIRYPWTPLTGYELDYACNDVIGLVEALETEMKRDGDNLYTIPLTSTGYVRRDVKAAMSKLGKQYVKNMLPDFHVYKMLREAFRGGNTHANRYFVGEVIDDVESWDRASSYPDVQCNCLFPVSKFRRESCATLCELFELIYVQKRAVLMRVEIRDVKLRRRDWGCPYISVSKCRKLVEKRKDTPANYIEDNGRIISAERIEMTLTDIDFEIIKREYDINDDNFTILEAYSARYGILPKVLTDVIRQYFTSKTELKGVDGMEVFYMKSKALLNAVFGMSAQNPVKDMIKFFFDALRPEDLFKPEGKDEQGLLDESNKKAFFPYQWGVWTTAWARLRLEEGIELAHGPNAYFLYCDTDSVKYFGTVDWTAYNKKRVSASKKSGSYASDKKGDVHYMGVYENESKKPTPYYEQFVTLGAKKYAYKLYGDEHLHCVVAGVSKLPDERRIDENGNILKIDGGLELEGWAYDSNGKPYRKRNGTLEDFKEDFIFSIAGGSTVTYVDFVDVDELTIDGHTVEVGPNITIQPGTYTLTMQPDYVEIVKSCRGWDVKV